MYENKEKITANRRETKRVYKRGQIYYSREGQEKPEVASPIDISTGGARLVVDRSVRAGDLLKIFMDFGNNMVVTGTARAVWSEPLPGNIRNVAGFEVTVEQPGEFEKLTSSEK